MIISLLGISIVFPLHIYLLPSICIIYTQYLYSYLDICLVLLKKKKNELLKVLSLCLINLYIHLRSSKALYGADTDIYDGTTELCLVSH